MADLVYCYPDSDTLINKLNIRDFQKLQDAERDITARRLLQLYDHPIKANFDYTHLKRIHRYIFQDIYAWAGRERTVDIAKSNMFCNVMFLASQAAEIFEKLKQEHCLKDLPREKFIERAAYYFGEINALHPFREGNGRTQREFFRELALNAGYKIDYSNVTEEEMITVSRESFLLKYDGLIALFDKITIP